MLHRRKAYLDIIKNNRPWIRLLNLSITTLVVSLCDWACKGVKLLHPFVMSHRRTNPPLPESKYFFLVLSRPYVAKSLKERSLKERTKNTLAQYYCEQKHSNSVDIYSHSLNIKYGPIIRLIILTSVNNIFGPIINAATVLLFIFILLPPKGKGILMRPAKIFHPNGRAAWGGKLPGEVRRLALQCVLRTQRCPSDLSLLIMKTGEVAGRKP
jgi:hypothetical protein